MKIQPIMHVTGIRIEAPARNCRRSSWEASRVDVFGCIRRMRARTTGGSRGSAHIRPAAGLVQNRTLAQPAERWTMQVLDGTHAESQTLASASTCSLCMISGFT